MLLGAHDNTLQDVNDNEPYFLDSDMYITLPSDLLPGSTVTSVHAFDKDVDDSITYSISESMSSKWQCSCCRCYYVFFIEVFLGKIHSVDLLY